MSKCSKTCGGGKRDKHRLRQPKEGYDVYCGPSVDVKSEDCNTDPCPSKYLDILTPFYHQYYHLVKTKLNYYNMMSIIFIQLIAFGVIGRKVVVVNRVVEALVLMKESKL